MIIFKAIQMLPRCGSHTLIWISPRVLSKRQRRNLFFLESKTFCHFQVLNMNDESVSEDCEDLNMSGRDYAKRLEAIQSVISTNKKINSNHTLPKSSYSLNFCHVRANTNRLWMAAMNSICSRASTWDTAGAIDSGNKWENSKHTSLR